ncbi:hypothetical protein SDC9_174159 [bioreactor metagenome]|uniref:Uncharacterized protein n=1 Tax=bioreactor metagenome TaxID=1076179 RepID=A0A645GRX1_9ZZZZ
MGFIEGVLGEIHHLVEHLFRDAARNPIFDATLDEVAAFALHHVLLFLGHGAAHQVASSQGISGQVPHDLHHLFLINHATVGGFQNGL